MKNLPENFPVPQHVALIMDGNGRWAESRKRPRLFGHKAGVDSVKVIVETARELGIQHLTLYAFSTENWQRPVDEVSGLMGLLQSYLEAELDKLLQHDIKLCCIGQIDRLPVAVYDVLQKVIRKTSHCTAMTLNLALSYGSRAELTTAVQDLARQCVEGRIRPEDIDQERISAALSTQGQPDPDLLIRTGGENRLSNFLLWQASYAELYFTEVKWPDFRREEFLAALELYNRRQRRFGKTGSQVLRE